LTKLVSGQGSWPLAGFTEGQRVAVEFRWAGMKQVGSPAS